MASKLDVFRAELQASQARESMLRSEASLASALERFRAVLALAAGRSRSSPRRPRLPTLERPEADVDTLVRDALARRLELVEARDQVDDARRAASLARQNLLPQLDLNVSLTQSGFGGSFGDAWTAGDRRVDVSVSASYPLRQSAAREASALARIQVAAANAACGSRSSRSSRTCARRCATSSRSRRASSCRSRPSRSRPSSAAWRCYATSAASAATSTSSTPRAAWWRPAAPSCSW